VDERSGAFQSLTLGPYRLVHSGDVKVYEHLAVLPRAFVAAQVATAADDDAALALLAGASFDPAVTVILPADASPPAITGQMIGSEAAIVSESPEAVTVRATGPGYLVLTDAFYPGWTASVDGAPATIWRADVMFRAVALPEGEHTVLFAYQPWWLAWGFGVACAAWVAVVGAAAVLRRRSA
jgi:hypothetical protein